MTKSLSNNRNDQRRTDEQTLKDLVLLYKQSTDPTSRLQYATIIKRYRTVLASYSHGN